MILEKAVSWGCWFRVWLWQWVAEKIEEEVIAEDYVKNVERPGWFTVMNDYQQHLGNWAGRNCVKNENLSGCQNCSDRANYLKANGWRRWSSVSLRQSRVLTHRNRTLHQEATKGHDSHFTIESQQSSVQLKWSSVFGEEPGFDAGRMGVETLWVNAEVYCPWWWWDSGSRERSIKEEHSFADNRGWTTVENECHPPSTDDFKMRPQLLLLLLLSRFSLTLCVWFCAQHRRQPSRLPRPWDSPGRTLEWVAISFSNAWKWKVKVKLLSRVQLFTTPWTAAYQAPLSMGFSRQEYWSGVPLPSPETSEKASKIKATLKYRIWPTGV